MGFVTGKDVALKAALVAPKSQLIFHECCHHRRGNTLCQEHQSNLPFIPTQMWDDWFD